MKLDKEKLNNETKAAGAALYCYFKSVSSDPVVPNLNPKLYQELLT